MNLITGDMLYRANREAIYNVCLYIFHISIPYESATIGAYIGELENIFKKHKYLTEMDFYRLKLLKNALRENGEFEKTVISDIVATKNGLTAGVFTRPCGEVSVVFKGTGSGEWIDNGEGLSGIPEENTYIFYNKDGSELFRRLVHNDFASDQQVEALNYFRMLISKNSWSDDTDITVSGHSKGGNKAQFVTLNSIAVSRCFSFDAQGFSPEAVDMFQKNFGREYDERRQKILSLSAQNDYVSVLGIPTAYEEHIYYFKSKNGIHPIEAILDKNGVFLPQTYQGRLSRYAKSLSDRIMALPPDIRKYATLGIMNLFQKYLGKGTPVNDDKVSSEKTVIGLAVASNELIRSIMSGKI